MHPVRAFEDCIADLELKIKTLEKIIDVKVYTAEPDSCVIVTLRPPVHAREVLMLKEALTERIIKHLGLTGKVQLICTDPGAQISLAEMMD